MSASHPTVLPPEVAWMMAREEPSATVCRGGILNDKDGARTICLLKNGLALRTLIVCPPARIAGWTEALRANGFSVQTMFCGSGMWWPAPHPGPLVWLTTYPKATMYRRFITLDAFDRIVLDEGHVLRNGKATARWMAAMCYAKNATCRWILTASPVQDSYSDWKNLCWWLRVRCPGSQIPELAPIIMFRPTVAVSEKEPTVPSMSVELHLMSF